MKKICLFFSVVVLVLAGLQAAIAGEKKADLAKVVNNLKSGGYVVYMRHPQTDKSQKDTDKKNLANCKTQRNLSELGRTTARQIGEAVKTLKVNFSDVQTSEYCRARQVPELMGIKDSKMVKDLNHSGSLSEEDSKKRAEKLKGFFATAPKAGANTLLIGHSPNITAVDTDLVAAGFSPADMLVFKPKEGKYSFIARITPKDWEDMKAKAK